MTEAPVVTNFNQALQSAKLDEGAGIAHAALAGSADFRVHITKLLPGAKVKAHRHDEGDELYIIQAGTGTLYTGRTVSDCFACHLRLRFSRFYKTIKLAPGHDSLRLLSNLLC